MSPRYVNVYKKNNEPIYKFNHETLNGLAVASEYVFDDPDDLKNPKYFYTDYVQLLKDVEIEKKIKVGTPIVFTGKIGNVDYCAKITNYGRLRISKIIDADVDKIGIFSNEFERISAKSAADGVEKRKALTKFALRVVTLAGVVTFDYKFCSMKQISFMKITKKCWKLV